MLKRFLGKNWHWVLGAVIAVGGFALLRSEKHRRNEEAHEDALYQVSLWCRADAGCISSLESVFDPCYEDNHSWKRVGRRKREHVLHEDGVRACLAQQGIEFPERR